MMYLLASDDGFKQFKDKFNTHRSRDSAQRQLSAIINYNIDGVDNFDPEYIVGRTTGAL